MLKLMDYMISPYPVRIIDPKVEAARLRLKSIRVGQAGHLPGRTLFRSGVTFEHWALVYIVAGGGTYTENGGPEQQVHEGSLFFSDPVITTASDRRQAGIGMNTILISAEAVSLNGWKPE